MSCRRGARGSSFSSRGGAKGSPKNVQANSKQKAEEQKTTAVSMAFLLAAKVPDYMTKINEYVLRVNFKNVKSMLSYKKQNLIPD